MTTEAGSQFRPHFLALHMTNFLSYKAATLNFNGLIALVGPNASGKSNAVAAIKLLREIPIHGLPTAIARRGGFDQLRHRSAGRPNDPALRITFTVDGGAESYYELKLGAVAGQRYRVKHESAEIFWQGRSFRWESDGKQVTSIDPGLLEEDRAQDADAADLIERRSTFPVAPGLSGMSSTAGFGGYLVFRVLQQMQTVEVNPARVGELQEPSSIREFEPDGSNTTSIYEQLSAPARTELIDELAAIVPGITRIEVARLADRQTLKFVQETASGPREFYAKQMSDGTLRAFSILLAMLQPSKPVLLVIEEPEIAIHLGALRTLVDILHQQAETSQLVVTTHSADIVDSLSVEALRVVWSEGGASRIGLVAAHTRAPVREGLVTPGQLLRSDALDPEVGA